MFIEPTKEQIETIPEIKEIYDNYVKNFGEPKEQFFVALCDRCGKIFDINSGWNFEANINFDGLQDYDICDDCGNELVIKNIKEHKKTDFYVENVWEEITEIITKSNGKEEEKDGKE